MSDVLKKDKLKEGVSVLTLNRPEVLNSLNKELVDSLLDAFDEIYEDNSIRSVIITGEGRLFINSQDETTFEEKMNLVNRMYIFICGLDKSSCSDEELQEINNQIQCPPPLDELIPECVIEQVRPLWYEGNFMASLDSICDYQLTEDGSWLGLYDVRFCHD